MSEDKLRHILTQVQRGQLDVEEAVAALSTLPYENLGFARLDYHRTLRTGFPEVVFCQGKTPGQVARIVEKLVQTGVPVLATRATPEVYRAVYRVEKRARYYREARVITVKTRDETRPGVILVVSAGTSDIPVAEEAAITVEMAGYRVERLYDVGVAGLHRLLDQEERLRSADVIIVVAGMDGALPSVVKGLTPRPVIAVPTSVGYGASFGGLAALLAMLNSCAPGIGVVNIDNGFGAAALADAILRGKGG